MRLWKRIAVVVIIIFAISLTVIIFSEAKQDYAEPIGRQVVRTNSLQVPFTSFQPSQTLIGISCSGGGSRAAYFSAAVLREIHRSKIELKIGLKREENKNLLEHTFSKIGDQVFWL